ncbi:MAG: MBL fold metallo-hydrolase [Verrucomicrobiota bacterium]
MTRFRNLSRYSEIGANCYYLEDGGHGVVLDAGMHPKYDGYEAVPELDLLDRMPLDGLFVTHAHHDHTGAVPLVQERFPDMPVFMSEPTYFLAEPLLHNSVNVMKKQRYEQGIRECPLYTHPMVTTQSKMWRACHFDQWWSLDGHPLKNPKAESHRFRLHHAGHILGSASIELQLGKKRVLYTGDINFTDQTILKKADLPESGIDTLIIETTRGTQSVADGYSREQVEVDLIQSIQRTFDRHGAVLMPIFAMGKSQELLTLLYRAQRRGELPMNPLFIGGLGKVFSQIYDRLADKQISIFEDIRPQVLDWKKMDKFKPQAGHIYLLPSGMMNEMTTSNRLAKLFLSDPRHSVYFVGYADPDSPAGKLKAADDGENVILNRSDGPQRVRCDVRHFDFTSHAQREDILSYIKRSNPRQCILVHGDPDAMNWFDQQLNDQCPKMKVIIPEPGKWLELD